MSKQEENRTKALHVKYLLRQQKILIINPFAADNARDLA